LGFLSRRDAVARDYVGWFGGGQGWGGSAFFFEKKNQRTFKSFFASFFSKKEDPSFLGLA
jgi:hypothetical protein